MTESDAATPEVLNLSGELQLVFQDSIVRRDLTVARVESITPRYRRVTLTGEVLNDGFPFARLAPADHVKVYFPDPRTGRIVSYRPGRDADDDWTLDPGPGEPVHRDYTVRGWNPVTAELVLEFVVHDHGVAGTWARDATAGDPLVLLGPSATWLAPANYPFYLAVGDETALPAISRIIEEAPAGAHVTAVVEIADAAEERAIEPAAGVTADVVWVHRDTAAPGAWQAAVRSAPMPEDPGSVYVFAAGEVDAIKPIRRYFRHELGLPKRQVHANGYWKRGITSFDHHDDGMDED